MRPPNPLVLRLHTLHHGHQPLLLTLRHPRPAEDLTPAQVRAALSRAGIAFAESSPDASHRVYWALHPSTLLSSSDPDVEALAKWWAERLSQLDPDSPLAPNLRFVYESNSDPISQSILSRYPEPVPDTTLHHPHPQPLGRALSKLKQGAGLRYFFEPGSEPPHVPGFTYLAPRYAPGAIDYWRLEPRARAEPEPEPCTIPDAELETALGMAAQIMGAGDSVLLPPPLGQSAARRLVRALTRADKPGAVSRQTPEGWRIWSTKGMVFPKPPEGLPAGNLLGQALTVMRGVEVPEVSRGRPRHPTPAPMAPGQALYYPDPGAARSAWRSLKNRGHPARVGRNEAGRWFVVIDPKEDPDA